MSGIVILGSSNTDMVLYVPEIPKPGETIRGDNFAVNGGGKGANQAVAAARAVARKCPVYFIACVGDDSFGRQSINSYIDNGIEAEYIFTDVSNKSGSALIFVAESGENTIGINPGANASLTPEHINRAREAIEEADYMLTQLESPLEAIEAAFALAKESDTKIILNPAPAGELPAQMLEMVDYITPNQTETEFYTGIMPVDKESAYAAADVFHLMGIDNVIITMGSKGSFYSNSSYKEFIAARKVTPVDTVAAGDTFNGAFVAALALGLGEVGALNFATTAAAIAVTKKGAQESAPYYNEIINFRE